MTGTQRYIERIELVHRDRSNAEELTIHIDVYDSPLSRQWLSYLSDVVVQKLHLEKNYCFMGFPNSARNGELICQEINRSILAINNSGLDYHIDDDFQVQDLLTNGEVGDFLPGSRIQQDRFNRLHHYFEDLQGVSGRMSPYYEQADAETRWHIRQLNLLCHEFETWALSWRKQQYVPEWSRPSQLMCWLRAPRFRLRTEDLGAFGLDSLYRDFGGVYLGVNKAIGKHHWEVFKDEGSDSRINELTTTTLNSQTEAAADFDIEWGQSTRGHPWMSADIAQFRQWLIDNGFDPEDPELTIGHPKIAQVDFESSFGTGDFAQVWKALDIFHDVAELRVAGHRVRYDYHWSDTDFMQQQLQALQGH